MTRVIIGYSCCPLTRKAFESVGVEAWTCDLLPARDGSDRHLQCDIKEVANDGWDGGVFHPMCTYLTCSAAWAFNDPDFDKYPGVGYHQKVKPGTLTGQARREAREKALDDVRWLLSLPYPKAIENPAINFINKSIRKPDQKIQPYQFGDDASKNTGLWIDGLPKLRPTKYVEGRLVEWPRGSGKFVRRWANQTDSNQNNLGPSEDRWLERSKTYPGIASAIGVQWGNFLKGL